LPLQSVLCYLILYKIFNQYCLYNLVNLSYLVKLIKIQIFCKFNDIFNSINELLEMQFKYYHANKAISFFKMENFIIIILHMILNLLEIIKQVII
jgi:hypothetical protein